jgi:hypothetical protein
MFFRDGLRPLSECERECPIEMEFEQPNATDASGIQQFPVLLCEQRLFCYWELSL